MVFTFQIVMVSTKRLMHNSPGRKASTAVSCAVERSKKEWILFTERTGAKLHETYTDFIFLFMTYFLTYFLCPLVCAEFLFLGNWCWLYTGSARLSLYEGLYPKFL